MLKLRFIILKERVNSTYADNADKYIRACICLHNYAILNNDLIYNADLDIDEDELPCQCRFCKYNSFDLSGIVLNDEYQTEQRYLASREKLFTYFINNHLNKFDQQ